MIKRLSNYSFDWKLSLFTLLLLPLLVNFGFWQLSREQEKKELQGQYNVRQTAQAIPLSELEFNSDLQYSRIQMRGTFDNDHHFLLDNKINNGRVGFEVITPFYLNNAKLILVNRGWAAQGQYRTDLPIVDQISGIQQLTASVYVPLGEQVLLGNEEVNESWPMVIQAIDIEQISNLLGIQSVEFALPYTVRLEENMPGVLVRNWPVISTTPEKHRGYAIQWFLMALVLFVLYVYASTRVELESDNNE